MENINLNKEMFAPLSASEKKIEAVVRPSVGYWADAWRRLKSNKVALVSLIIIALIIVAVFAIPLVYPYTYDATNLKMANQNPSLQHIFGTDDLGRDLFIRVIYGTKYSLIIAFVAAIINLIIGVIYGSVAGFFGGMVDNVMMRVIDILYSIPTIIYVVLISAIMYDPEGKSTGLFSIILALSISYWINMARIVRSEVLQLKQQEFVLAATALGASKVRILFKHLLPNCLGSIIVTLTLLIPQAIFTEAFLSFIGLGLNPPLASLGTLANSAMRTIYTYQYQLLFPSVAICLVILSFNLFGDGLTEALDPKNRR